MRIADVRVVGKRLRGVGLVEVESDSGLVGIGSTSAPPPVFAAIVEQGPDALKPMLLGRDPRQPLRLWREMFEGWQARRGRGGEGGMAVNAMAAIDMALWDLAGKAAGQPLHRMLGGAVMDRVEVYASATAADQAASADLPGGRWERKSKDRFVEECKAYVAAGFKAIKFGWGNAFDDGHIETLKAMREAVGAEVKLALDFGCPAYNRPDHGVREAIAIARKLEPLDLFFLEEALKPYDVDGFAALTAASPVRIATGESLVTLTDFQQFIGRRAIDIVQADAQQIGVTVFRQVAALAEAAGMWTIPHCPWTAMAIGAHLQVLCTHASTVLIEYPAMAGYDPDDWRRTVTEAMNFRIVDSPPPFVDGCIEVTGRPGLGLGQYVPEVIAELEELEAGSGN